MRTNTHSSLHHADFSQPPTTRLQVIGFGEDLTEEEGPGAVRHKQKKVTMEKK